MTVKARTKVDIVRQLESEDGNRDYCAAQYDHSVIGKNIWWWVRAKCNAFIQT